MSQTGSMFAVATTQESTAAGTVPARAGAAVVAVARAGAAAAAVAMPAQKVSVAGAAAMFSGELLTGNIA